MLSLKYLTTEIDPLYMTILETLAQFTRLSEF